MEAVMIFSLSASGTRRMITKLVSLFLVFCFSTTVFAQDTLKTETRPSSDKLEDYLKGKIAGKEDSDQYYKASGWTGAGIAGGFLLGIIGAGLMVGISQIGSVKPDEEAQLYMNARSDDYKKGYFEGYSSKGRRKKLNKTLVGGAIGTAFAVALYVAVASGGND
jgi:hypothetical protein